MHSRTLTRREVLKAGVAAAAAGLVPARLPDELRGLLALPATCAKLTDIEHVVRGLG